MIANVLPQRYQSAADISVDLSRKTAPLNLRQNKTSSFSGEVESITDDLGDRVELKMLYNKDGSFRWMPTNKNTKHDSNS
jgi:hypothetical protein